ncbi:unnamed protein product [Peronospora belbahrii]|uniref:Uncharacterized protein n=1 Tax=Peronospora belbahrii TaxID=622444 RepID=A0AAU9KXP1_9STRA|nr:unnamed protein product [Peronospora belbahrii]
MSETKQQEAKDVLRSRPSVDVKAVNVSPNPAALADELNLEVRFHLETPITNGIWDIEYLVDLVTNRHMINILSMPLYLLRQVEATSYAQGDNRLHFSTPRVNVSDIQSSQLINCGLLIASLKDDAGDIMDLKMVIQVSEQRGGLQRIIYSPLE